VLKHQRKMGIFLNVLILSAMALAACGPNAPASGSQPGLEEEAAFLTRIEELQPRDGNQQDALRVVTTTNIVTDVVASIAGEEVQLTGLVPWGADPHTYQPTAGDLRAMVDADVVFINGAGLEQSIYRTLAQVAADVPIISLSQDLTLRRFEGELDEGAEHAGEDEHGHEGYDPHVWFDPQNVRGWVQVVEGALRALDPGHADLYAKNAQTYDQALSDLDLWIEAQVASVPAEQRSIVSDHFSFGYFADRYGFNAVGAVIPAYSTAAEPSAQEMAALSDLIENTRVPAIFVGVGLNPQLAQRLTEDTGIALVPLYTGALSAPNGPASDYLAMMQYDVQAIVTALTH